MFPASRYVFIAGGTFNNSQNLSVNNQISGAELTAFQRLEQAIASNTFHNSDERFDPPKCHPGTRIAVIERIMAWMHIAHDAGEDASSTQELVLWMNGKAGAGKSAIAQTIAEECEAAGLLLASFFFSRSDPTRNHGRSLIATLAYQMASVLPHVRSHLEEVIKRDPLIFQHSVQAQMSALIVASMRELSAMPAKRLVIIDGLDECHDPKVQENILHVIAIACATIACLFFSSLQVTQSRTLPILSTLSNFPVFKWDLN